MAEPKNFPLFAFLLVIAIGLSAFVVFNVVRLIFNVTTNDNDNDIRNWVSLTIESGIGIFISMMVLYYDKLQQKRNDKQQQDIENLVKDIKKIEENQQKIMQEQEQLRENRIKYSYETIDSNLIMIDHHTERISTIVSYLKNDHREINVIENEIKYNLDEKNYYVNQIEMIINLHGDLFDPNLVAEILDVCRMAKSYVLYDKDGNKFNFPNIISIHTSIEKLRTNLHSVPNKS